MGENNCSVQSLELSEKNKSAKVQFDTDVLKVIESDSHQIHNLSDRADALKNCLKKLSEKDLHLLKMRYHQDLSFKKMALKLGVSKQSAYRLISRIHAKLIKCIKFALDTGTPYEYSG